MKNTVLILFLLSLNYTYSQTNRSIEVIVKDTIELKVVSSTLFLTLSQEYEEEIYDESYYDDYDYESEYQPELSKKELRKQKKANRQLEKELKKMEYEFTPPVVYEDSYLDSALNIWATSEPTYENFEQRKAKWINYMNETNIPFDTNNIVSNEDYYYGAFTIRIDHIDQQNMKLVYDYIDSVGYTDIETSNIIYESIESKMESSYEKLYKKAQIEANALAKVIGATPGKVIRVYEPEPDFSDLLTVYRGIIENVNEINNSPGSTFKVIEKVFVFEIK